ncbi:hypothetical protein LCGC14_2025810, partial [marine sediment metagenome]
MLSQVLLDILTYVITGVARYITECYKEIMKKYFIFTYGCQMNKSDSERIASFLEEHKYKPVLNYNKADLIIVNMCSVRQSAVDRIYGLDLKFQKLKKKLKK